MSTNLTPEKEIMEKIQGMVPYSRRIYRIQRFFLGIMIALCIFLSTFALGVILYTINLKQVNFGFNVVFVLVSAAILCLGGILLSFLLYRQTEWVGVKNRVIIITVFSIIVVGLGWAGVRLIDNYESKYVAKVSEVSGSKIESNQTLQCKIKSIETSNDLISLICGNEMRVYQNTNRNLQVKNGDEVKVDYEFEDGILVRIELQLVDKALDLDNLSRQIFLK